MKCGQFIQYTERLKSKSKCLRKGRVLSQDCNMESCLQQGNLPNKLNCRLKMATSPFPSGLWISHLTTGLTNLHVLSSISQSSACLSSLCICLSPPITLLLTYTVCACECMCADFLTPEPTYMKETVGDNSSPSPIKPN